ncbi:hypothetical protein ATE84_2020 [Aquimarina sp. MAR_2010_214]|uniref:hypothetical protein n=1 Tax=Aquimarina sp. MAR_2010_214 TaxID=1250026 RepID=UPI000CB05A56|nr:hypothetical protein [Aquimarina sp. MAR_2010_214]PKV49974.1 hypothetical protein ATE84_2020 [Aquimarina sp. MAR_2010_214]
MKKSILNLGKVINKAKQKTINGGQMEASCEELGWNESTCEHAAWSADANYHKCC